MSGFYPSMTLVLASLFPWLIALGVSGTVVLLVALALCGIGRPPARSRVSIYRAAVVALLCLPILSFLAWSVAPPSLRVASELVRFEMAVQVSTTNALDVGEPVAAGEPADIGKSVTTDRRAEAERSNESSSRTVILIEPLFAAAAGLWIAGATVLVLRLILGLVMLHKHRRSAESVEPKLRSWARSRIPAKRPLKELRVLRGGPLSVPVCWGLRRATILLPAGSEDWAEERTHAVVEHELSHLHAGDPAFLVATRLAVAFHWLNPLAWVLQRLLDRDAEEVCDEMVIEAGINPHSYARALVESACEARRGEQRSLQVAMAHHGDLERRIEQILAGPPEPVRSSAGMVGVALILVMTVAATLMAAPLPKSTNLAETRQAARADTVSQAEIVEALVGALADPAPEVRRSAINSLRDIGDQWGLTQLEALLNDPDVDVRRAAEGVLGRRPAPTNLVLPSSSSVHRPAPSALDSIAEHLSRPDFRTRLAAAQALGNLGSTRSTAALVSALDDEDPRVREAVARALGHTGDPGAVAPLVDAWPDTDGHVRAGIVSALGEIGKPGAAGVVINALEDEERHVRQTAAEALGKLGRAAADKPVPASQETRTVPETSADTSSPALPLDSPLPSRVREAGLASRPDICRDRLDPDDAPLDLAAAIRTLLEDPDPLLRERAAWGIGGLVPWPADVEELEKDHHHALIAGLSDPAQGVRIAAACGLGKLGNERALEFLTLRSRDPESAALRRASRWAIDMIATRSQ